MVILIGTEDSKRTLFFRKAAEQRGVSFRFIDWKDFTGWTDIEKIAAEQLQGAVVKIDPPSYQLIRLQEMQARLEEYRGFLKELEKAYCKRRDFPEKNLQTVQFFNSPGGILQTLDKGFAKQVLMENGIAATEMFSERPETVQQLLDMMKRHKAYSVFVKPEIFSGAAGVVAFRQQPSTGRMAAYTSCKLVDSEKKLCLYNTKTLFCMENPEEIFALLEELLKLGVIVERWHPKDMIQGKSYDLRVVYQFGKMEYIVVRQSGGPITNLHLNNQAMDVKNLKLSRERLAELEELCGRAMGCFDGLSMAGIDVMLDKGSRRPRIIEMNGQGDLIYQDIFGENRIYGKQIEELCN